MASNAAQTGHGAGSGRYLPCAGDANHFDVSTQRPAAQQSIERTREQALGNDRVPARHHYGKFHALGREVAFDGHRLAFERIGPGPEGKRKSLLRLNSKNARVPVAFRDAREVCDRRIAALGAQPALDSLMHGIQSGHLHQHIGGRGKLAIDKLQVAQRRQKCRAADSSGAPTTGLRRWSDWLPHSIRRRRRIPARKRSSPAAHRPRRCRQDEERRSP